MGLTCQWYCATIELVVGISSLFSGSYPVLLRIKVHSISCGAVDSNGYARRSDNEHRAYHGLDIYCYKVNIWNAERLEHFYSPGS